MIVDPDQNIGSLVGLASKLVLKSNGRIQDSLLLIPIPRTFDTRAVAHRKALDQHHVLVNINKDQVFKVYAYSLDVILARILWSRDVQQSLLLALLHAITSHYLPDLLTGYTGTESALKILQSAAIRAFEFLTADNVDILGRIATHSPPRCFYPSHSKKMQQVTWDIDLPSLSQHPKFRKCAVGITQQARTMQLFHPDKMLDTDHWKISDPHLEERDAIRCSVFRVHGFGSELFTTSADGRYAARDGYKRSDRGQCAHIVATLIIRDQAILHSRVSDLKRALVQTHFKNASIQGVGEAFDPADLRFDSEWLGDSSAIFQIL